MNNDKKPPRNYFDNNDELTIDGSPYQKPSYLTRSYVIGPLIFMALLIIGSIALLVAIN